MAIANAVWSPMPFNEEARPLEGKPSDYDPLLN